MTATHGEGVSGNAAGVTTPLEHKLAQAGEIVKASGNLIRPGLFWGGNATVITGKANMSFDVIACTMVSTRGASSGAVKWSNDGVLNVATTAAPGSNSRIDITYAWHREYSLDGVNSDPVIGVIQGTAAAVPAAPSLAAFPGAIELGRATVGAGITATTSATITQTATFTATAGGVIPFRNTTERDAGTYLEHQLGWLLDTKSLIVYNGSSWGSTAGGRVRVIPTQTSTGGTVAVNATTGEITATGALTQLNVTIPSATLYKGFEITYFFRGSGSGQYTIKLMTAGTPDATASAHRARRLIDATPVAIAAGTSWDMTPGGRQEHWRKAIVSNMSQAAITTWHEFGGSADATSNDNLLANYCREVNPVVQDGFRMDFTSMSTLSALSVIIEGIL